MSVFSLLPLSSNLVDSYVGLGNKNQTSNTAPTQEWPNLIIYLVWKNLMHHLGEKLCKGSATQQTKPTVLWPPCLSLSASLGLKGLLRVALSYSAVSTSNQTFSSEGEQKKERKKNECRGRSWQKFPEGCQGESLYWNRRYEAICFVCPLATSLPAWKKKREKSVLEKIINSEHPHWPNDRFNQVSRVSTSQS